MDNVYISIDKKTYRKFDDLTQKLNIIRKVFERDPQDDLSEETSFSRDEIAGIYAFLNDCVTFCNELLVNTKFTEGSPPHTENKEQNNNLCCTDKEALGNVTKELNDTICNLYGFFALIQGYISFEIGENKAVDVETLADAYTEPLRKISQKLEQLAK